MAGSKVTRPAPTALQMKTHSLPFALLKNASSVSYKQVGKASREAAYNHALNEA